ncbi:hypothetical protein GCM10011594_27630 [Nakamurella endophytica]|uniref:Uncharacterized protein n=1 Tax=Nakamurella endophytica TaxID=1748367 RepID=A0A917T0A4_9ACTN|nr:hypothetical protein GCM10011594_27630 [Nakamurella endophytica]
MSHSAVRRAEHGDRQAVAAPAVARKDALPRESPPFGRGLAAHPVGAEWSEPGADADLAATDATPRGRGPTSRRNGDHSFSQYFPSISPDVGVRPGGRHVRRPPLGVESVSR